MINGPLRRVVGAFLLFSTTAYSAPLSLYRDCLGHSKEKEAARVRISSLRKQLGTEHYRLPDLSVVRRMKSDARRTSYSTYFRSLIQTVSDQLHADFRFGTPVAIDPAMSVDQYRNQLAFLRQDRVMNAFNSKRQTSQVVVAGKPKTLYGISALVNDLRGMRAMARPEEKATERAAGSMPYVGPTLAISTYLEKGPRNSRGHGISQTMGKLHWVEVREGQIDELHFLGNQDLAAKSPHNPLNERTTTLSLDMLLNLRTGHEDIYLEIQRILVRYFEEQESIFARRRAEIQKNGHALQPTFSDQLRDAGKKYAPQLVGSSFPTAGAASVAILNAISDITRDDEVTQYREKLAYFLEGMKAGTSSEERFIKSRLADLELILPTLQQRYRETLRVHEHLMELSGPQVAYLIDFFLQSRGSEILTQAEMARVPLYFRSPSACVQGASVADYSYFRNTAVLLEDLEKSLEFEVSTQLARKKDIQNIRRKAGISI